MLKLYNTLSKKIEDFKPLNDNEVRMYTCGPTVYNYAHIGNLRTYIFEDLLKRVLLYDGYKVNHAMNITDVGHLVGDGDEGEDKLEVGAKREGKNPLEIAKFYTEKFFQDTDDLNIIRPNEVLSATQSIPDHIEIIKLLEQKGFTYQGKQAVYFDTSKFADYGKLSGQKLSEKKTTREEVIKDEDKKHQADFALWFFLTGRYKNHILHWPSPWGEGFPGWHIECSAISRKLLGQPFDIHCGGVDHIGTHHSNEIAQSEAAFGVPLANIWMHGEFLVISTLVCSNCGAELEKPAHIINVQIAGISDDYSRCPNCKTENVIKMAKSGNNFTTLDKLKERGFSPLDYRYLCLTAHYRTQLNFTWEALGAANKALRHLQTFVEVTKTDWVKPNKKYLEKALEAMNDDLNIPRVLALVHEFINELTHEEAAVSIKEFDKVLGLNLGQSQKMDIPKAIQELINLRQAAREQKDFAKSDELRKQIEALGYEVMDTPEGQKIRKKLTL